MTTTAAIAKHTDCEQNSTAVGAPAGVRATLRLEFAGDAATNHTRLTASLQEPPLRVVRAFAIENGTALAHLHNVSGGLLGGDHLTLNVTAAANSRAQITTTGATRVYRTREDAAATHVVNKIDVGDNALLEWVPDAVIPFAGARFVQRTMIHLAEGAGIFWWEVLAPGREARGEIFEYASVELRTDILALGRPIIVERARLEPKRSELSSVARLGSYRTWATFYICRVGLAPSAWLDLEQEVREVSMPFAAPGETLWGISTVAAHGLMVRCLARQGRNVLPGLQAIWNAAKLLLYGESAAPPRKVN